jgi:translation initiation factor IF-3
LYPPKFPQRPPSLASKVRVNEQIRVPQIRLIGAKGEQIGIVPTKDGLRRADEAGLDLVEVAPLAKPPVCRILDFGKYLYSLEKKEKEARKKQKVIAVKEVKITSKIEEHDFQTKLRNARNFVERGDKVKLSMMFRGREITHLDLGRKIINRFIDEISDVAEVERNVGLEGNTFHVKHQAISRLLDRIDPLDHKEGTTMPKLKTNKAAKKRYRVTKNKKVLFSKSLRRHMMTDRSSKKKRQSRRKTLLDRADRKQINRLLPYGS